MSILNRETTTADLNGLGGYLARARVEASLSQTALAARCGLAQQQISYFEAGRRTPTLEQALRIARTLDIPIQRLLTGTDRPGTEMEDLALELRRLGLVDLKVRGVSVPGAFRSPEEVLNLALSGAAPDPRILEALPAALAWTDLKCDLLAGHATVAGTTYRLAWLADVVLAIDRKEGFPGGCHKDPLARFLERIDRPDESRAWDSLGKPSTETPQSPIWRRWKINYDAGLAQFQERASHLHWLRTQSLSRSRLRPARAPFRDRRKHSDDR
jgi:transcriptional regulator with XRE-family HTH domain